MKQEAARQREAAEAVMRQSKAEEVAARPAEETVQQREVEKTMAETSRAETELGLECEAEKKANEANGFKEERLKHEAEQKVRYDEEEWLKLEAAAWTTQGDEGGDLHEGWTPFTDPSSGRIYYWNEQKQEATWVRPLPEAATLAVKADEAATKNKARLNPIMHAGSERCTYRCTHGDTCARMCACSRGRTGARLHVLRSASPRPR